MLGPGIDVIAEHEQKGQHCQRDQAASENT